MPHKKYIPFWLKLFLVYSTIIICMFSITLIVVYPYISEHSKREIQTQLNEQSEQVIENLEYQLDLMRGIYISIAADDTLQNAFDPKTADIGNEKHHYILDKLFTISNIWGTTVYAHLYNSSTNILYNTPHLGQAALISKDFIDYVDEHEGMYNFSVINDANYNDNRVLTIGGILRKNIVNDPLGYFTVNLKLSNLQSLIIPPRFTDGTLHILVDENQEYVIGDPIPLPEDIDLISTDTIRLNGEEYLLCKSTSKLYKFTHYILAPVDEAYAEFNLLIHVIIVTVFVIILVSIIISFVFARQITNPIKKLTDMMYHYKADNTSSTAIQNLHLTNEFHILNDGLIHMSEQINTLINDVYEHEIMHQKLELKTLYKAINPHFIYNVLDTIQWELHMDKKEAAIETLYALSYYLRNTLALNQDNQTIRSMRESVCGYCRLHQMFFDDIICEIDIPEELNDYMIPSMLVLPLVENCFTHAFPDDFEGDKIISLSAHISNAMMQIQVQDTGCGISAEDLETLNRILLDPLSYQLTEGSTRFFAIKNIQSRILLSCGENYGLEFDSNHIRTQVTLFLPLQKK